MRKIIWSVLLLIAIVAVCTALIVTKPDETDYVRWMEDTYDSNCLDYNCDNFDVEVTEEGMKRTITMQSMHGGFSPGTFVMKKETVYRNFDDSAYKLDLEVKGFMGDITIVDEVKKLSKDIQ